MNKNQLSSPKVRSIRHRITGKIFGFAAYSKVAKNKIRKLIKDKNSVSKLNSYMESKREMRNDARHHLLANAFLKEKPYLSLEKTCDKFNKPNPDTIFSIIEYHLGWHNSYVKLTVDDIKQWLAESPSTVEEVKK